MAHDELSVDMAAMASEIKQTAQVDVAVESAVEADATSDLDSNVEVPENDFWGDGEDFGDSDSEASDSDADADGDTVPQRDGVGIITYKANGKDVQLNLKQVLKDPGAQQELAKQLALVDGARKAFSDKNKLRQKLKEVESSTGELSKYKESWDKLEAIKDNPAELYRVLTGEDFNQMIEREAEKRAIYSNASDEDRKIMDYEERIRRMEMAQEREGKKRQQELEKIEQQKYEAEKQSLHNGMQKEFFKYEFDEGSNPAAANKLRKMLWRNSVADIQDYIKQGYKYSDRMVTKAFKDNASALQSFYKTSINKSNKENAEVSKANAQTKAASAATKNYQQPVKGMDELVTKDPLSIFQAFRRGRR